LFQDTCRAYVPKTMTLRASLSFLLCLYQATLGSSRLLTATSAEADVWTWERLFSSRVSLAQGCLNFLHIPKTAGTTIEHLSPTVLLQKERGEQSWGAQDHLQNYCSRPGYNPRAPKCYFESSKAVSGGAWCSPWHVPPSLDERLHEHYAECTTFCVVRHPAERLVSQFRHEGNACNLNVFRHYVAQTLPKVIQHPFKFDCHFLPQVEYVFGSDRKGQYCQDVLHYENLTSEFDALMKKHNLTVQFEGHFRDHHCELDIPPDVAHQIKQVYREDYEAFGYEL